MKDNNCDYLRASEHLRATVVLLGKWNIPPTPMMYQVVYDYVSGAHQDIVDAIERLRHKTKDKIEANDLKALHQKHYHQLENVLHQGANQMNDTLHHLESDLSRSQKTFSSAAHLLKHQDDADSRAMTVLGKLILENESLSLSLKRAELQIQKISRKLQEITQEASSDFLTGLQNRRTLDAHLANLEATSLPAKIVVFDIDHFKRINDSYGHLAGDQLLKAFSQVLQSVARDFGIDAERLYRYGGEEMVVLVTDMEDTRTIEFAETVRCQFAAAKLETNKGTASTTVSCGIAKRRNMEPLTVTFERADRCLYMAKHHGRNQSFFEGRAVQEIRIKSRAAHVCP